MMKAGYSSKRPAWEENSIDLIGMSRDELAALLTRLGQPAYRLNQLLDWLYVRRADSLDAMTDLPRTLRETIKDEGYIVGSLAELKRHEAADGTVKFLFSLADGAHIESVFIPEGPRRTVCLSTQAGCGMGCAFCATGQGGLFRNLNTGEIVGQVIRISQLMGVRISNVVAMGQGEPLANYEATVAAFQLMGVEHGLGIAARHLAISTCGLPAGIARLAREGRQWQLTVSLHAATDALRNQLMPINRRYSLAELHRACADYGAATGRRITLAYVLIAGLNDGYAAAQAVADFCRGFPSHVNLIPWNPIAGVKLAAPDDAQVARFRYWLAGAGVNATIRRSRGAEFHAACGQLRSDRREVK